MTGPWPGGERPWPPLLDPVWIWLALGGVQELLVNGGQCGRPKCVTGHARLITCQVDRAAPDGQRDEGVKVMSLDGEQVLTAGGLNLHGRDHRLDPPHVRASSCEAYSVHSLGALTATLTSWPLRPGFQPFCLTRHTPGVPGSMSSAPTESAIGSGSLEFRSGKARQCEWRAVFVAF